MNSMTETPSPNSLPLDPKITATKLNKAKSAAKSEGSLSTSEAQDNSTMTS